MTHDPPATAAQREPDRDFLSPRRAAREQHVGQVQAGDQQHDAGHSEKQRRQSLDVVAAGRTRAQGKTRKRFDHERLILLLDRPGLLEIRGQRLQRRISRGRCHARLQPADEHELPAAAIIELALVPGLEIVRDLIVNPERQPDLRRENLRRAGESLRHDSDHGERAAVDRNGRARASRD